jgi:hypothetical protein
MVLDEPVCACYQDILTPTCLPLLQCSSHKVRQPRCWAILFQADHPESKVVLETTLDIGVTCLIVNDLKAVLGLLSTHLIRVRRLQSLTIKPFFVLLTAQRTSLHESDYRACKNIPGALGFLTLIHSSLCLSQCALSWIGRPQPCRTAC